MSSVKHKYAIGMTVCILVGVGRTPGQAHQIPAVVVEHLPPAGRDPRYVLRCSKAGVITRRESKIYLPQA